MSPTDPRALHLRDGVSATSECGRSLRDVASLRDYPRCLEHLAVLCDECAGIRRGGATSAFVHNIARAKGGAS